MSAKLKLNNNVGGSTSLVCDDSQATDEVVVLPSGGTLVNEEDNFLPRAWVKFNGADGSISATSGGVASIVMTDTATYEVTLSFNLTASDFPVQASYRHDDAQGARVSMIEAYSTAVNKVTVITRMATSTTNTAYQQVPMKNISLTIWGKLA